ncbi:MAG: hypothetical protein AAGF06_05155 [Pseudomonadota bacterium]
MSQEQKRQQMKNKSILLLLLLTPLLVMLAATITYKVGYVPETRKNNGVLLQPPAEIMSLPLTMKDGQVFDYVADNKDYGRWHIVHFGDAECAEKACKESLWLSRQAHVALSHRAQHVQRYYVSVGGTVSNTLSAFFTKEHPRLKWLSTESTQYREFMSQYANTGYDAKGKHQFALVDPNGWLMMYYPENAEGSHLIQDLKYLLKKRGK